MHSSVATVVEEAENAVDESISSKLEAFSVYLILTSQLYQRMMFYLLFALISSINKFLLASMYNLATRRAWATL